MKHVPTAGQQLSFTAKLENWAEGMDYCAVRVPAEITAALGTISAVAVVARVNESEPFAVSLFPIGGGVHYIRIKAKIRHHLRIGVGDSIQIHITVVDREEIAIPDDLVSALRAEGAADAFKLLPPSKQGFIIRRINDAAKPETRQKRIQEAVLAAHERREKLVDQSHQSVLPKAKTTRTSKRKNTA
jgi:hypothetical protein